MMFRWRTDEDVHCTRDVMIGFWRGRLNEEWLELWLCHASHTSASNQKKNSGLAMMLHLKFPTPKAGTQWRINSH